MQTLIENDETSSYKDNIFINNLLAFHSITSNYSPYIAEICQDAKES